MQSVPAVITDLKEHKMNQIPLIVGLHAYLSVNHDFEHVMTMSCSTGLRI